MTSGEKGESITVKLSAVEVEAIVRACNDYRRHIPSYLESRRGEQEVFDRVIDKLVKPQKTKG